jgi:osmotically-inducible protein OsmY
MRLRCLHVAAPTLLILSFTLTRAAQQNPPAQDQQNPAAPSQQTQPPGAAQPNPDARQVEKNIQSAFNQDPNHAFRRVRVQNTDSAIILSGVVTTADAKQQAEQIANQYAGGKKVRNQIKVNPNVHPGPG